LTLGDYAAAKRLPIDFLKSCGLSEFTLDRKPAVRIPYFGESGEELAVRFRIALDGDRFRWKSGTKPRLYGLNRLSEARRQRQVILVEGESDCHTLWFHGIPAVGIPGATNWREERDARNLDEIETIYIVVEPDHGGDAVRRWLSRSTIRHRAKLVNLPAKDPSALHLESPDEFLRRWQVACLGGMSWTVVEAKTSAEERSEAWEKCGKLALAANILDEFAVELSRIGVVGERHAAKLIYLALTSRLMEKPVSIAVKGPSAGGKSFVVESALKFFPPEAFYALTAMSDRALAYSSEPLKHRHLVIYEAAGLASDFATYLIRSFLSEGRLRYETVEKTKEGLVPRLIEREGPTGLS
jgi:5S rRNA maturation endonuclease (ribonuclease M5)